MDRGNKSIAENYRWIKQSKNSEYTNTIQIGNNFLILMIDDIKIRKAEINKENELNKLINFETTKQLTKFSKIFLINQK